MPRPAGGEKRAPTKGFVQCGNPLIAGDPIPSGPMTAAPQATPALSLADIRAARTLLGDRIRRTPVQALAGPAVEAALAPGTRALLKLELFQHTGSFKARGALVNALSLTEVERARGICAISAGNHEIGRASCRERV